MSTEPITDSEMLNILARRQDQHLTLMALLEGMRWKFTSAFGISALVGLSYAATNPKSIFAAATLAIITSIAGILVQVRVLALAIETRSRIRDLQEREEPILKRLMGKSPNKKEDNTLKAFVFVPTGIGGNSPGSKTRYAFSAGMAGCLVFATIIGITIGLVLQEIFHESLANQPFYYKYLPVLVPIVFTLVIFFATLKYSFWYMKKLKEDKE